MANKHICPFGSADVALPDVTLDVIQGIHKRFCPTECHDTLFRAYTAIERRCDLPSGAIEAFDRLYLSMAISSKFLDKRKKGDAKVRYDNAIARFRLSEELCRETNSRFINGYRPGPYNMSPSSELGSVLDSARRIVLDLLGDSPDMDAVAEGFNYGPGATTSLRRPDANLWNKFGISPDSSSTCLAFVEAFLAFNTTRSSWLNSEDKLPYKIRETNKIVTVEKNSETDRVIAIEPDWNMFFQKGFGHVIRKKLKRVGVDLNKQLPNQQAAQHGSLTGLTSTIDLSMASDCMAIEFVRYMVPPKWYARLEQLRVSAGVLASGEVITYQKFSSMGNGFTFELESLLFWAVVKACCIRKKADVHLMRIYGDDIVCPMDAHTLVVETLEACGFKTNATKTFSTGGFRESCGKHYFWGEDVTPVYIRKNVDSLSSYIKLANAIRSKARMTWGLDGALKSTYDLIVSKLPYKWRQPRIPFGVGDAALWGDFDEALPKRVKHGYFRAYKVKGLVPKTLKIVPDGVPSLLWFLHIAQKCDVHRESTVNITVDRGYVERSFYVGQWCSYGPWIGS